eukprot:c25178_g1_i7 orf=986-2284(-)
MGPLCPYSNQHQLHKMAPQHASSQKNRKEASGVPTELLACESSCMSVFADRPNDADIKGLYIDGDKSEVEERSHRILFPVVAELVRRYKEHGELEKKDEFRLACAVCPDVVQFRGWVPLLIHAQKFWKSFRHQHRGYYKALKEVFRIEEFEPLQPEPLPFPPVLLVENAGLNFDGSLRRWRGLQGEEVPENIRDIEIEEVLAVYKKGDQDVRGVLVFPSSEVGFVDANKLNHVLETCPNLNEWIKFRIAEGGDPENYGCSSKSCTSTGSLGEGSVETQRTKLNQEKDKFQTTSAKNLHDNYGEHRPLGKRASLTELKSMDMADSIMEKWSESFARSKGCCAFSHLWPFRKSQKLREMDAKFQEDLQRFKFQGVASNDVLRAQLEAIEKQLCKERLLWLKEINEVREQIKTSEKELARKEFNQVLFVYICRSL